MTNQEQRIAQYLGGVPPWRVRCGLILAIDLEPCEVPSRNQVVPLASNNEERTCEASSISKGRSYQVQHRNDPLCIACTFA